MGLREESRGSFLFQELLNRKIYYSGLNILIISLTIKNKIEITTVYQTKLPPCF